MGHWRWDLRTQLIATACVAAGCALLTLMFGWNALTTALDAGLVIVAGALVIEITTRVVVHRYAPFRGCLAAAASALVLAGLAFGIMAADHKGITGIFAAGGAVWLSCTAFRVWLGVSLRDAAWIWMGSAVSVAALIVIIGSF